MTDRNLKGGIWDLQREAKLKGRVEDFLTALVECLDPDCGHDKEQEFMDKAALPAIDAGMDLFPGRPDQIESMWRCLDKLRKNDRENWVKILRLAHETDKKLYGILKCLSPMNGTYLLFIEIDGDNRVSAHGELEHVILTILEGVAEPTSIASRKFIAVLPDGGSSQGELLVELTSSKKPKENDKKGGDNE